MVAYCVFLAERKVVLPYILLCILLRRHPLLLLLEGFLGQPLLWLFMRCRARDAPWTVALPLTWKDGMWAMGTGLMRELEEGVVSWGTGNPLHSFSNWG